jgi:hypothetical protein
VFFLLCFGCAPGHDTHITSGGVRRSGGVSTSCVRFDHHPTVAPQPTTTPQARHTPCGCVGVVVCGCVRTHKTCVPLAILLGQEFKPAVTLLISKLRQLRAATVRDRPLTVATTTRAHLLALEATMPRIQPARSMTGSSPLSKSTSVMDMVGASGSGGSRTSSPMQVTPITSAVQVTPVVSVRGPPCILQQWPIHLMWP